MSEIAFTRNVRDETADEGKSSFRHWTLTGPEGSVHVVFMRLPEIDGHWRSEDLFPGGWSGADFGYHSPKPLYPGHESLQEECDLVPGGGQCYYSGSSIPAMNLVQQWWRAGQDDEVIWRAAELAYRAKFLDDLPTEPGFEEKMRLLLLALGHDPDDPDALDGEGGGEAPDEIDALLDEVFAEARAELDAEKRAKDGTEGER